jgi:hypothetical protein
MAGGTGVKVDRSKTQEITKEEAHSAIFSLIEEMLPAKWRIEQWKALAEAVETKVFHFQGNISYSKEMTAHDVRLRAMEQISKIAGDFPKAGAEGGAASLEIIVKNYKDVEVEEKDGGSGEGD